MVWVLEKVSKVTSSRSVLKRLIFILNRLDLNRYSGPAFAHGFLAQVSRLAQSQHSPVPSPDVVQSSISYSKILQDRPVLKLGI